MDADNLKEIIEALEAESHSLFVAVNDAINENDKATSRYLAKQSNAVDLALIHLKKYEELRDGDV